MVLVTHHVEEIRQASLTPCCYGGASWRLADCRRLNCRKLTKTFDIELTLVEADGRGGSRALADWHHGITEITTSGEGNGGELDRLAG
jgi:hypothetical protein